MVTPSVAFFDTSVLLGGLIELGPASAAAQQIYGTSSDYAVTAWR